MAIGIFFMAELVYRVFSASGTIAHGFAVDCRVPAFWFNRNEGDMIYQNQKWRYEHIWTIRTWGYESAAMVELCESKSAALLFFNTSSTSKTLHRWRHITSFDFWNYHETIALYKSLNVRNPMPWTYHLGIRNLRQDVKEKGGLRSQWEVVFRCVQMEGSNPKIIQWYPQNGGFLHRKTIGLQVP